MKTSRITYFVIVFVLAFSLLAGCAQATPTAAPTTAPQAQATAAPSGGYTTAGKVIYDVGWLKGHPVIRLMTLGFIAGCNDLGYKYKLLLSDGSDINILIASYEQAIAEGATGIVGYIHDPALGPVVKKMGEANIPFVSAHFPQPEGQYPGLTAWVAADNVAYAKAAAKAMGDELARRGVKSGTIAMTEGSFNTVENNVAKYFKETMNADHPEFKVLDAQEEGFDPPTAIAKASAIISANPDIIGALSTTGAGPTTWATAADETGHKPGDLVIISMDYTRPNLDLVKGGKVFGLIAQPLFDEFRQAVHIIDAKLRGQTFAYANPLPSPIITKDTIQHYYDLNDQVEAILGAGANAPGAVYVMPTNGPTWTPAPAATAKP